ncbi:MAG: Kae1-associated kinase Bud32 [Thermoplasmata archaeon]|nr:MAG: Kae1-associated kinase Bud32 [Thermoplasmata archaeon]
MEQKIIAQGAEAILIKKQGTLVKNRIKKSYRHPFLDTKIRRRRTKKEARIMKKVANIIAVPKIKKVGEEKIEMGFLEGKLLSKYLDKFNNKKQKQIAEKIAESVANLHKANIIHGDLTTSNMILKDNKVYFIDFGLAFHSARIEDKAVDIHLLKQALESKHFRIADKFFKWFVKEYSKYDEGKGILSRLTKVELRGRYKRKRLK